MSELAFAKAFSLVNRLAADFEANERTYLEPKYNETQARTDFIDKFWIALGWDVNHEREKNPYQQEVKVERGVKVSNRLKKADYAFFAAPNFRDVKFYVEAKKPSRNLDNADDYFQTIRYGWSSNTPLAVLTDFEQFRVIDCRYKPNIKTAENFALKKFSYREYADEAKFREIYHLFSRESVNSGSLEDYANSLPKRGRGAKQGRLFAVGVQKSVDESFLDDLDAYRAELARAFKNRNAELNGEDLTEAVTRTIDRLVFIRFLEDKLIEPETMMDKFDSWADFVRASAKLNGFYNGIIFKQHFIDSPDFKPDDKVFTDICGELSDKNTPYYFGNIPAHILGSVYERFLGKVIVATGKRAHVEEKPEVRKAGGVYYTPEYIVRYIVENTIGKLIENKTPEEIAEMRFADIACGSGSFLLGVYDYLLRYHTTYYNAAGKKGEAREAGCIENADGSFMLSIGQRRDILRNNVFGVDVDAQATEVAQLSLALKLLEDATTATARAFQPKLGEKILPDMTKNIVCGNSLIDHDILDGQLFERNEERKLNPMSYEDKFPEIMRGGGFDAIVGNPPYGADLTPTARTYLRNKFDLGTTDTAALMMLQSVRRTKSQKRIGLIVPKSFTYSSTWETTRENLIKPLEELIDVGKVWKEVKLEQAICFFSSTAEENYRSLRRNNESFEYVCDVPKSVTQTFGFYVNGLNNSEIAIATKMQKPKTFLGDIVNNTRGGMFQKLVTETTSEVRVIGGKQIQRLFVTGQKGFVSNVNLLPSNSFVKANDILVQNIVAHIANPTDHIKIIGVVADKEITSKIVILDTVNRLSNASNLSSKFLLALLHSKLINWYVYRFIFAKAIRTMHFDAPVTNKIPIPMIDLDNITQRTAHDKIVSNFESLIEVNKLLANARTDKDQNFYQDKCNFYNRQINALIYDLYDLSLNERIIIDKS
ncbi:MAG: Eco57I restriction-modification methylase domain-containing protein [Pyrinomonadaceae bacterium]